MKDVGKMLKSRTEWNIGQRGNWKNRDVSLGLREKNRVGLDSSSCNRGKHKSGKNKIRTFGHLAKKE
jgi:hypothetical protein